MPFSIKFKPVEIHDQQNNKIPTLAFSFTGTMNGNTIRTVFANNFSQMRALCIAASYKSITFTGETADFSAGSIQKICLAAHTYFLQKLEVKRLLLECKLSENSSSESVKERSKKRWIGANKQLEKDKREYQERIKNAKITLTGKLESKKPLNLSASNII